MLKGVVIGMAAIVLIAVGLWYGVSRSETEVRRNEPVHVERGSVQPNRELANIFTELEKEWTQVGTTLRDKGVKPIAGNGVASQDQKEKK